MNIKTDALSNNLRGIILMILATMLLTSMSTMVRSVAEELDPLLVAFFRNFFGLLMIMPILIRKGVAPFRTQHMGLMALRGGLNAAAMILYFIALGMLPLAEISALSFTTPLFVALLVVPVLGERLGPRRIGSLIIGFSGALIIIRPGIEIIDLGALLALGSAAVWAGAVLVIKYLARTDSPETITMYGLVFLVIFTLPPALFVWQWPTAEEYLWLLAIAAVGTLGQLLFAHSLMNADASLVTAFDFTKLIWASLFGILIFAEIPTIWTWLGGAIIFASASYVTYRESQEGKTKKTPSVSG